MEEELLFALEFYLCFNIYRNSFYFGLLRDFLFLLKCEPLYGYTFGHNLHLLLSLFHRPFTSYLLTPPGEQSSRSYFDFKFTPNSVSDLIFGLLISFLTLFTP
jgi:hypothetical protein